MSFKDSISGCFGSQDLIFSAQFYDEERARKMLIEALQETKSWGEYEDTIKNFLKDKGASDKHIEEQLRRVKDLSNYFSYD